jgi:hypothetical protein
MLRQVAMILYFKTFYVVQILRKIIHKNIMWSYGSKFMKVCMRVH